MSDPGLVSVVLPTRNRAALLPRAIHSVLGQTHRELELIVVDDASSDGTAELIASIPDARLRYLRLDRNLGVSGARNAGIAQARGNWLAFQDSDDEWRVEKLQRQLAAATADTQMVLCGSWYPECPWQSLIQADPDREVSDVSDRIFVRIPAAPTFLIRAEALRRVGGFDAELSFCEDWELALRIHGVGQILWVNQPLVIQHRTPDSLFTTEINAIAGLSHILRKHEALLRGHAEAWSWYSNWLGQTLCQFDRCRDGRRHFLEAIRARPATARSWLNLAASLLGSRAFRAYLNTGRGLRRALRHAA